MGEEINFSGHATDEQEGELPASNLSWDVQVVHCADYSYTNCPPHYRDIYEEVASGQYIAPYHELPTYMQFTLTATDSEGLTATDSVRLYPKTIELSFRSEPSGLVLFAGEDDGQVTPFTRTEIVGSTISLSALSPQTLAGVDYEFVSWSDGGAGSHEITAGEQPSTYTATYKQPDTTAPEVPVIGSPSDGTVTSDNTPEFSGTAEAGSTIELFDGSTSLGTSPADGSGGWSFTPSASLSDGTHPITAKATDAAGNQSAASEELLVTVDTQRPSGNVLINNGRRNTSSSSVTLELTADDPAPGTGVASMRIANSSSALSSTSWEPFATSKTWQLRGGAETKTVYVQYRDDAGNESEVATDTIMYRGR